MTRLFLLSLILLLHNIVGHAQDLKLEIIPLRHRLTDEVLPVLQPLVAPGGTLSGMNNQLIIRTTETNLVELKQVLARIDQAARRLKIYVRQDVAGTGQVGEQSLSGRYRTYSTQEGSDERNLHFVQAIEGQPAFISTGQSIPVPNQTITYGASGVFVTEGIQYRDLNSGFYVVPRVNGEQVTLSISPQRERLDPTGGGAIDTQSVQTTVTGQLGEWTDLGGVNHEYRDESGVNLTHTRRYGTEARGLYVKKGSRN